jgi:hypothetical protein
MLLDDYNLMRKYVSSINSLVTLRFRDYYDPIKIKLVDNPEYRLAVLYYEYKGKQLWAEDLKHKYGTRNYYEVIRYFFDDDIRLNMIKHLIVEL